MTEEAVRRDVRKLLDDLAARGLVTITEDRTAGQAERRPAETGPILKAVVVLTVILALAFIVLLFVVN